VKSARTASKEKTLSATKTTWHGEREFAGGYSFHERMKVNTPIHFEAGDI
jgi:hypothetical protein